MNKALQTLKDSVQRLPALLRPAPSTGSGTPIVSREGRLHLLLPRNWPETSAPVQWCVSRDGGIPEQGTADTVETVDAAHRALPCVVWWPAAEVLLERAVLPDISKAKLAKAIPYALEDRLLGDIEDQYFVWERIKGQATPVCVVTRERVRAVLDALKTNDIHAVAMMPVTLGAPLLDNSWTLVCSGNDAWLRTADYDGTYAPVVDGDPPYVLTRLLEQAREQQKAPTALVLVNAPEALNADAWASTLDLEVIIPEGGLWENHNLGERRFNLLQGEYAVKSTRQIRINNKLLPAAVMLAVVLAGNLLFGGWQWWKLGREASRLRAEMVTLFKQAFPDQAGTVLDPVKQMQVNLDQLRSSRGGASRSDFLTLLAPLARTLDANSRSELDTIDYRNDGIKLTLKLANYQALDRLKEQLSQASLAVEVIEANSGGGGVNATLRITPGGST